MIGQAQTGTGKTAAFGLPLLQKVDPKVKSFSRCPSPNQRTCDPGCRGTTPFCQIHARHQGPACIRRPGHCTPDPRLKRRHPDRSRYSGTCYGHMRRKTVKMDHVHTVVLDEADEMLNMGFLEDMETILSQLPEERQTLMFSATMPQAIADIAKKFQKTR